MFNAEQGIKAAHRRASPGIDKLAIWHNIVAISALFNPAAPAVTMTGPVWGGRYFGIAVQTDPCPEVLRGQGAAATVRDRRPRAVEDVVRAGYRKIFSRSEKDWSLAGTCDTPLC